jgi:hypothetical protein
MITPLPPGIQAGQKGARLAGQATPARGASTFLIAEGGVQGFSFGLAPPKDAGRARKRLLAATKLFEGKGRGGG